MQENAASHAAKATFQEKGRLGTRPTFWPANSSDLNTIEINSRFPFHCAFACGRCKQVSRRDFVQETTPKIARFYPQKLDKKYNI